MYELAERYIEPNVH